MKSSGFPRPRLPHSSAQKRWAAPPAVFSLGNKKPRLVSIHAESTGVTGVFDMRPVLEGSGRDADPCQRQLLGPSVLANRRGAAPPPCLLHRLPSLNRVVPQHAPPSHGLRWAGRNVAIGPDGYPLRMHCRRVGFEVTQLLLLLGIQPPLNTSFLWSLVEAAVLVGHEDGLTTYSQPSKHG